MEIFGVGDIFLEIHLWELWGVFSKWKQEDMEDISKKTIRIITHFLAFESVINQTS